MKLAIMPNFLIKNQKKKTRLYIGLYQKVCFAVHILQSQKSLLNSRKYTMIIKIFTRLKHFGTVIKIPI